MNKVDYDECIKLTEVILNIGTQIKNDFSILYRMEPFKNYFSNGELEYDKLNELDGEFTRRELLARVLLTLCVIEQGPDISGVIELFIKVVNNLYFKGVRIFHEPKALFLNIRCVINVVLVQHEKVKKDRRYQWAEIKDSSPKKYNLIFSQSQRGIVSSKQVLPYVSKRWGMPLLVCIMLGDKNPSNQPLVDYLKVYKTAEVAVDGLKDNEIVGLGDAIGDKACHLFVESIVSFCRLMDGVKGWSGVSYGIPFDSNVGRVLWRTGFLTKLLSIDDYKKFIDNKGYMRITNLRSIKIDLQDPSLLYYYRKVEGELFGIPKRVKLAKLPYMFNLFVSIINEKLNLKFSMLDFDKGLMKVGMEYCHNTNSPNCSECPLTEVCLGYKEKRELITGYKT